MNRRSFLKNSLLACAGLAAATVPFSTATAAESSSFKAPSNPTAPKTKLNIGVIGMGERGISLMHSGLLSREDVDITAICDIDPKAIARAKKSFSSKGKKMPKVYDKDAFDYLNLLQDKNVDAVIISTPWEVHVPMSLHAMQAKKYVAVEVYGAYSIDECWDMVRTHEETGTHLFFLENVCYRRDVMAALNMVKQDVFGELIHMECGYQHDLRNVKFNNGSQPYGGGVEFGEKGFSEAHWRTYNSVGRNGDVYPTHGLGPVAQMLDINRGNRLMTLTSTASKARGLHDYIINHPKGGPNHPNAKVEWKLGDIITTVIKTMRDETIIISHDTNLPRPYSLGFRVQGTKGLWMDINQSVHIEGISKGHQWDSQKEWFEKYEHPLWKKYGEEAKGAGHGGMDWFVLNAFIENAKRNEPAVIDVYDAATWLAVSPMSEESILKGGAPVYFPDFTRGKFLTKASFPITGDY